MSNPSAKRGVRAAGSVVGFASFDPSFPGAVPFRTTSPRFGRALFDAMRPHARPEHLYVRAVVEGDAALERLILDAGARVFRFGAGLSDREREWLCAGINDRIRVLSGRAP